MTDQPAMTPAERSKRYRQRRQDGIHLIALEIDQPILKGLCELGFIHEDDVLCDEAVKDGIDMFMRAVAESGVELTDEWMEKTDKEVDEWLEQRQGQ